jgi:DNA-binding beta-propeller fold protein YncE
MQNWETAILKSVALSLTLVGASVASGSRAEAQRPLVLEAKIPLGDVRGRIDHMAVDLARRRLFVAELENDSVGVADIDSRKVVHVITDVSRPQGLGYVASTDTLFVANGGNGSLRMFQGAEYRAVERIHLGDDADNVRVDAEGNQVFVSYGNGALAVIDVAARSKIADVALPAHPESFQLDRRTNRIYVNIPAAQAVAVVDRALGKSTASWQTGNGSNFPMALDEASNRVLVVLRNPAQLVVFAMQNGSQVTRVDTCADADDMFVDAKRRRAYVSCGDGFLDVFDIANEEYRRLARVATVAGARTSLYVPEMDRLFVAARATPEAPAAVWIFRPEQ